MRVNLDGVVFGLMAAVPHLEARGGGSIVITASMAGVTPLPFDPIYSMTKHGLVGLVRSSISPLARTTSSSTSSGDPAASTPTSCRPTSSRWCGTGAPRRSSPTSCSRFSSRGRRASAGSALADKRGGVSRYEFTPVDMSAATG
jgi:hypothetical protein